MIKITVPSVMTRNQAGIAKTSGKAYNMDFQTVYAYVIGKDGKVAPFPEKTEIILDKDNHGIPISYPVGEYQLSPASLYIDRTGNFAVAPRLVPLNAR